MAGSRLRWWDPTFPTWDENLIPPGIPHLMRDSCIPPGILGGTYAFYPGSWSGFTYPTWDSLSQLRKYCFAVFILTKRFCESSNTYGSSTHSANIWHADKTEVHDSLPASVVKTCFPIILPALTSIINTSLKNGMMPYALKVAVLKPLLKKQ